jgi:biopolymer transport protein TolR
VKTGSITKGLNEANITPLADVTTTLIVVFLITMPAILWNGINVKAAQSTSEEQVVAPKSEKDDGLLTVAVTPEGITVNEQPVERAELQQTLALNLRLREDRTVLVVPSDRVQLGEVVEVLDTAKAAGAEGLALLNEIEGGPR